MAAVHYSCLKSFNFLAIAEYFDKSADDVLDCVARVLRVFNSKESLVDPFWQKMGGACESASLVLVPLSLPKSLGKFCSAARDVCISPDSLEERVCEVASKAGSLGLIGSYSTYLVANFFNQSSLARTALKVASIFKVIAATFAVGKAADSIFRSARLIRSLQGVDSLTLGREALGRKEQAVSCSYLQIAVEVLRIVGSICVIAGVTLSFLSTSSILLMTLSCASGLLGFGASMFEEVIDFPPKQVVGLPSLRVS